MKPGIVIISVLVVVQAFQVSGMVVFLILWRHLKKHKAIHLQADLRLQDKEILLENIDFMEKEHQKQSTIGVGNLLLYIMALYVYDVHSNHSEVWYINIRVKYMIDLLFFHELEFKIVSNCLILLNYLITWFLHLIYSNRLLLY